LRSSNHPSGLARPANAVFSEEPLDRTEEPLDRTPPPSFQLPGASLRSHASNHPEQEELICLLFLHQLFITYVHVNKAEDRK